MKSLLKKLKAATSPDRPYFRILSWAYELGKIAFSLLVLGLLLHYFVITIFALEGASMEPTLKDKEYVLVNRSAYLKTIPKRGDIVLLKFPGREQEKYIKRVIGLPGETIKIKDGAVYINNQLLREPYLSFYTLTRPEMEKTLGEDEFFVMGDNRDNSNDSRIWGSCPKKNLIGKAIFIVYPLSEWSPLLPVNYFSN